MRKDELMWSSVVQIVITEDGDDEDDGDNDDDVAAAAEILMGAADNVLDSLGLGVLAILFR